jgi:methyl-accepting chemotaxis protein
MNDLKVRSKLILCFSIVLLCFGMATLFTGMRSFKIAETATEVEEHAIENASLATKLLRDTMSFRLAVRSMLLQKEPAGVQAEADKAQKLLQNVLDTAKQFATLDDTVYKEKATELVKAAETLTPHMTGVVAAAAAGNRDEAFAILSTGSPIAAGIQALSDSLITRSQELAKEAVHDVAEDANSGIKTLLSAFVIATLLSVAGIVVIVRAIVKPLTLLGTEAEHLARGDISRHIQVDRRDEIGALQSAFANMSASLNRVLNEIRSVSGSVTQTAQNLGHTAEHIRESAETQSGATSSMAAALEEMSTSVDHVASLSHNARDSSAEAGRKADHGNNGIQEMVSKVQRVAQEMNESAISAEALGQETQKISSIVDVIKELADQTNLLALNAAIEAARAGEQGRGFAVVADEVRKLAERTTQSTNQISAMVSAIQSSGSEMSQRMQRTANVVREGLVMAEAAGGSVQEINRETRQVLQAIDEVSHALKEQSQASHDIARQVDNIVNVVDENAHAATGMADVARDMQRLAQQLDQTVSSFRLRTV